MTIKTPEDFAAEACRILATPDSPAGDVLRLLVLAANEYQAAGIERYARTPQYVRDDAVRRARAEVAEQIARSIETVAAVPADTTADEIRCLQAREDAATARRIGQTYRQLDRAS
jgi:hypothetical protein